MSCEELLKKIDENRELLESQCHLSPDELVSLDNHYRVTNTFSSNAIEGNRFSLLDTKLALEDGITVGGKTCNDLFETLFHAEAFDSMLKIARENSLDFISGHLLDIISELHHTFYKIINMKSAGVYRDRGLLITNSRLVPPPPHMVGMFMEKFRESFADRKDVFHPVCLAAYAHLRFAQIHPFIDGNGRIARLLMNLILVNKGYQFS
jgi:Fic family protein